MQESTNEGSLSRNSVILLDAPAIKFPLDSYAGQEFGGRIQEAKRCGSVLCKLVLTWHFIYC